MVQVLAVEVMMVLVVVEVCADGAGASAVFVYMVSVLIVLLGKWSPRADAVLLLMISAFGEILVRADGADGARPPLSSTHYGLQRRCGAGVDQRSAAFGSPAQLASPIRLGSMSARQSAEAARPARLRGKRYGRLCRDKPATDSHLVHPPDPQGR